MKYQGEHTFVLDAPQSIKLVFELEGDRASAFTLHQGEAVTRAPRLDGMLSSQLDDSVLARAG